MTTEAVLSPEQLRKICDEQLVIYHHSINHGLRIIQAVEQAVLQSPELQALRKDAGRLDWLLNNLGGFHAILFEGATPLLYRGRHLKSADALRGEINAAMEKQP